MRFYCVLYLVSVFNLAASCGIACDLRRANKDLFSNRASKYEVQKTSKYEVQKTSKYEVQTADFTSLIEIPPKASKYEDDLGS